MKKSLLFFLATAMASPSFSPNADAANPGTLSAADEPIIINESHDGPNDKPRTRSGVSAIEAWLDTECGTVSLQFNVRLGVVSVSIVDSFGNVSASCNCDTALNSTVLLSAPTTAGSYTISIVGSNYSAEGYFFI